MKSVPGTFSFDVFFPAGIFVSDAVCSVYDLTACSADVVIALLRNVSSLTEADLAAGNCCFRTKSIPCRPRVGG